MCAAISFTHLSFAKGICFRGEENTDFVVKFSKRGLGRTVSIYDQKQKNPLLVTAKLKRRLSLIMGPECDMALAFDRDGEVNPDVFVDGFDGNKYLFDIGFSSMSASRCLAPRSIPTAEAGDTFDGI